MLNSIWIMSLSSAAVQRCVLQPIAASVISKLMLMMNLMLEKPGRINCSSNSGERMCADWSLKTNDTEVKSCVSRTLTVHLFLCLALDLTYRPLSWAAGLTDYTELWTGETHSQSQMDSKTAQHFKGRPKINPLNTHPSSFASPNPPVLLLVPMTIFNDYLCFHSVFNVKVADTAWFHTPKFQPHPKLCPEIRNKITLLLWMVCLSWSHSEPLWLRIKLVTLLSCVRESGATLTQVNTVQSTV